MRLAVSAAVPCFSFALFLGLSLSACDGCQGQKGLSAAERDQALASAIAAPVAAVPSAKVDDIGHAANVIPGQGPKRIEFQAPRIGSGMPILAGQGVGPIRFGANKQTIERLIGAPCDEATETRCLYVGRALDFELEGGVVTEIRVSRKGREAKRAPDGSILEYGFYNGALLPDLYFGMHVKAIQEQLGPPQKVESITPMGADGFAERHVYDGLTLEYDRWSNDNLVLGAIVLTKSATAAAQTEKKLDEMAKAAAEAAKRRGNYPPTRVPR